MIGLLRSQIDQMKSHYINALDRRHAYSLWAITAVVFIGAMVALVLLVLLPLMLQQAINVASIIPIVLTIAYAIFAWRLLLSGQVTWASRLFVALLSVFVLSLRLDNLYGTTSIILLLPLITAAMFLKRREVIILAGLMAITTIFAAINQSRIDEVLMLDPAAQASQDLALVLLTLGLGLVFLLISSGISERMAADSLKHDEHMTLLQDYHATIATAINEDAVLIGTWDILVDKMDYVFMQVYQMDADGRLNTYARTGMGTRHVVRRTDLPAENVIRVVNRQHHVKIVTTDMPFEERGHLLPSVNYAMALPLMVGAQMLGVLDVQSNAPDNPFSTHEIIVLKLVASELAHALFRLREKTERESALEEQRRATERLEAQIISLRRQLDQTLGSDWLSYLESRGLDAFGFDLSGYEKNITPASGLPEDLKQALTKGEMVIEQKHHEQVVTIPIKQRDEVLGAMSFGLPLHKKLTDRQIEMAHNVANRLGVALENARLVEQSQAQANRERKTGEVANLLLGQQEVRALLDTAAESFNDALGAIFTRIHLNPDALLTGTRNEEVL